MDRDLIFVVWLCRMGDLFYWLVLVVTCYMPMPYSIPPIHSPRTRWLNLQIYCTKYHTALGWWRKTSWSPNTIYPEIESELNFSADVQEAKSTGHGGGEGDFVRPGLCQRHSTRLFGLPCSLSSSIFLTVSKQVCALVSNVMSDSRSEGGRRLILTCARFGSSDR